MNNYASPYTVAAQSENVRAEFYKKTYLHLAGAIIAFALIETAILSSPLAEPLTNLMLGGQFSWLIVLGIFMFTSYIAQKWAVSATSKTTQYAGLGLYVVAQSVIFVPLLGMASWYAPEVIGQAAIITLALVAGITFLAFTTKKDFSFLSGFLKIGGFIALGLIAASIVFGFDLGIIFSVAMVIFASVSILRDTSNIIHHYSTSQYVAASLGLFASVALLFWYVLQILLSFASND